MTGFPVIFIPNKMDILNKHSKSGAQMIWSIYVIDMVNKQHKTSLCTMISRIMWESGQGKTRQLFHSDDEGITFGWYPQFRDQTQIVTTGLRPYLTFLYDNQSVESYFSSPHAVDMQSKQRWDSKKKGGEGEYDERITSTSGENSGWDDGVDDT